MRKPTRRELQALLRPAIFKALEHVPADRCGRRVARALLHEALLVLQLVGLDRTASVNEVHRVLVKHFSSRVTGPFGNRLPIAKA